jgi:hypothetical protein
MMNYDVFREYVKEHIAEHLDFEPEDIEISKNYKTNSVLYGITIKAEGEPVSPCVYLENSYEDYKSGSDIDEVLDGIAATYEHSKMRNEDFLNDDISGIFTKEYVLENVYLTLVSNIQNAEFFTKSPEYKVDGMRDISGLYRVMVNNSEDGIASYTFSNNQMSALGITREELDAVALDNTQKFFPSVFSTLSQKLGELGVSVPEAPLYVISNAAGINGATTVLYKDKLAEFAEKVVGDDLILLPSSIHEFLALPKSEFRGQIKDFAEMVQEVNMTQVKLDERLSNNVYTYDMKEKKISQVSDVNKNLNGESMNFVVGKSR